MVLESGTAGPDLTGTLALGASGGFRDENANGLWETDTGESLNMRLDAAVSVGGYLLYYEVD